MFESIFGKDTEIPRARPNEGEGSGGDRGRKKPKGIDENGDALVPNGSLSPSELEKEEAARLRAELEALVPADLPDNEGGDENVYEKMRTEVDDLKNHVEKLLVMYPELKDNSVYSRYQRQLEKLEPKITDDTIIQNQYSLVRALMSSVERQVREIEQKGTEISENQMTAGEKVSKEEASIDSDGLFSWGEVNDFAEKVKKAEEDVVANKILTTKRVSNAELSDDDSAGLFAWGEKKSEEIGMEKSVPLSEKDTTTTESGTLNSFILPGTTQEVTIPKPGPEHYAEAVAFSRKLFYAHLDLQDNPQFKKVEPIMKHMRDLAQPRVPVGIGEPAVKRLTELAYELQKVSAESGAVLEAGELKNENTLNVLERLSPQEANKRLDAMYAKLDERLGAKGFKPAVENVRSDKKGFFRWVGSKMGSVFSKRTPEDIGESNATSPEGEAEVVDTPAVSIEGETSVVDTEGGSESAEAAGSKMEGDTPDIEAVPEKLPDHKWENDENHKDKTIWDFAEGKMSGIGLIPSLESFNQSQRSHIIQLAGFALGFSPDWRKKIGVGEKFEIVSGGNMLHTQKLNEFIQEVASKTTFK